MKPVISYYGGKQRMSSKIIPYIPKHTVYCEPFCGGASVFFMKPWPNVSSTNHYREVLNDTDGRLINFYRQMRDNGAELVEKIKLTLYSEEEHRDSKDFNVMCNIERARRYYINIQQSFSNKLNSGWGRGLYSRNSAATWANKLSHLDEYLERMAAVYISNTDALKCICQWDAPQTFFYIDPPYPGTDQGHYSGYTQETFNQLVDVLKTVKGSFILSCYAQANMPTDWEKVEYKAYCSGSAKGQVGADRSRKATANEVGGRERTEMIWIKQSSEPRDEIKKLYASGAYDCFQ